MSEIFRDWWLYAPSNIIAPSIICPDVLLEDKKMRFTSKFDHYCVGLGDLHTIVDKCDKENIVNDICLPQTEAKDFVRWLNENIKDEKEMSFDGVVEKAISELWSPDEIAYSNIDGEYVIHEKKSTGVIELHIENKIPFKVSVERHDLDSGRCVYIIKEKKNGC